MQIQTSLLELNKEKLQSKCKNRLDFQQNICEGDGVFIPAGTWHNIINIEKTPLKISSIYAPPNHLKGTIHQTKSEAEKEEY